MGGLVSDESESRIESGIRRRNSEFREDWPSDSDPRGIDD